MRNAIEMQVDSMLNRFATATQKHFGFKPRQTQLTAAQKLLDPIIAEMATGEGKTLTLAAAASLWACQHRHVFIATANDYLAKRDAQWMQPIYNDLGLSASFIDSASTDTQRRTAYQSQVVYATIRELGFDFLRSARSHRCGNTNETQPRCDVLIVDEADSVLIDQALTPLVISAPNDNAENAMASLYRWAASIVDDFVEGEHFELVGTGKVVALNNSGNQLVLQSKMPSEMNHLGMTAIIHAIEQALWVKQTMQADRHYIIRDNRIAIVDEYTGRASNNRSFATGIQQSIEAQHGVPFSPPSEPIARISIQDFVSEFQHVCGTTGTGLESRKEFRQVYDVGFVKIRLHCPSRRKMLEPCFCQDQESKWRAIATETKSMIAQNRAVLIGTRSITKSLSLAAVLKRENIPHVVLNALNDQHEATVIGRAGQSGQVTVATNMAGRGTDIQLSGVCLSAGGLHVIVSEPHGESRIDRQLIGRCGRQGEPGSARIFASQDDQVFSQAFGQQQSSMTVTKKRIVRAQKTIAKDHRLQRARLTAQETAVGDALKKLGLEPYLDPLVDSPFAG